MRVFITGIGRGLGRELLRYFRESGHHVLGTARGPIEHHGLLDKHAILDFSRFGSGADLARLLDQYRPDIAIHNASPYEGDLKSSTIDSLEAWASFSFGALIIAKYAVQHPCRTIFIGSTSGLEGVV